MCLNLGREWRYFIRHAQTSLQSNNYVFVVEATSILYVNNHCVFVYVTGQQHA